MTGLPSLVAFALAALGTNGVAADDFPRQTQTSFGNNTTTPSTATGAASTTSTPAPCCWLLAGTRAVGVNKWYTSTAEHVVGKLIVSLIYPCFLV